MALVVAVVLVACSDSPVEQSTAQLTASLPGDAELVATIEFAKATDALLTVFDDGTVGALVRVKGEWRVQRFDGDGMIAESQVDSVGDREPRWHGNVVVVQEEDGSRCWVVDEEVRSVGDCDGLTACPDILQHRETEDGWVVWNQLLVHPADYDGRVYFPGGQCLAAGAVVGASAPSTHLFGADPGVLTTRQLAGSWGAIAASATYVWLHAITPDRRTWSVWKVPWVDRGEALRPITGPELLAWRWRIVELDGQPVEPVAWFQGKWDVAGFDGCTTYVFHGGGLLTDDPACPAPTLVPRLGDYRVDEGGAVMRLYSGRITAEPEPLPEPSP